MEGGGFGFPFGGDPEDLLRGLREFAEQQAETVQEAQREQFATLTLNTAVDLTAAALKRMAVEGPLDAQAVALRDAMRVLFPEAVALVSAARQGFMREWLDSGPRDMRADPRSRDRSSAAGGAAPVVRRSRPATSPAPSSPTRRRRFARSTRAGCSRRSTCSARRSPSQTRRRRSRAPTRRCSMEIDREASAVERQRQADRARARPRPRRSVTANVKRLVDFARRRGQLRPHRHGGRDDDRRDARHLRELRGAGYDNLGIVLQASSSERSTTSTTSPTAAERADLQGDLRRVAEHPVPRLQRVRTSFLSSLEALFDAGCYVGIATHDEWLIDQRRADRVERGCRATTTSSRCCSACGRELGTALVAEGPRLRIYVPFGALLVRVLAPAAPGEPRHRRLHRVGHDDAVDHPRRNGTATLAVNQERALGRLPGRRPVRDVVAVAAANGRAPASASGISSFRSNDTGADESSGTRDDGSVKEAAPAGGPSTSSSTTTRRRGTAATG